MLGASKLETFRRVICRVFARPSDRQHPDFRPAVAEFGAIVVVSGNIPGRTLTAPGVHLRGSGGGQTEVAAAVSVVLLTFAIVLL